MPTDVAQLADLEGVFENAVSAVLALVGIVLFIMLVMGGFKYTTAGGDPKKLEDAKKTLTYAVLGVAFIAISYLILRLIATLTGNEELLNFTFTR